MAAGDPGVLKRNFSATAIQTTLVNSISSAATGDTTTSVAVVSTSGFPSTVPYTLILDPDGSKEEVVTVTAASSTTLTITRGQDNTPAVAHSAGTSVRHGVSGRDFKEEQTHQAARGYDADTAILSSAGLTHVHGLQTGDGSVVGSTQSVTLTRKTLTTPTINGATLTGAVTSTAAIDMTGGTITGLSSAGMVASSAAPKSYVDAILGSATAASTSATSAATSATSAATSATSAATSATSSASSASAAATSASSALTSQTAAATSATSAAASATAAATSATSAAASATTSSNSAATATTQAANAATSATSAATSATSAAASATAAATSATSAAASATTAAGYIVPSQTGNANKALITNGTTTSWSASINGTAIPASKTLVDTDSSQTLTNKTLTSPVLTTPSISNIDAKGDILVGTANDTLGVLTAGNNGETLVADSSTSTGLRYQGSISAGRNFVINGGFDIWQRGTSFTGANSNTYTADRWNMYFGVTPTAYTISRQSSGLTGFPYAIRVQRNNGATDTTGGAVGSSIEIANATYLAGQNIVFSFYARKGALFSQASSIVTASLKTGTGSTDANGIYNTYTGEATPISQNTTLTTSWQRFTYTATLGSSVTQVAIQFNAGAAGTAGATDYYEIAGVQVEVGSIATQFSRAGGTIQGELAACQRYYYRTTADSDNQNLNSLGWFDSTTLSVNQTTFPVPMRIRPTAVETTGTASNYLIAATGFGGNASAVSYDATTTAQAGVTLFTISGGTAGRVTQLRSSGANRYLGWSAEL